MFVNNIPEKIRERILYGQGVQKIALGFNKALVAPNTVEQFKLDARQPRKAREIITEDDVIDVVIATCSDHPPGLNSATYLISYVDVGLRDYILYLTKVSVDDYIELCKSK